MMLCQSVKCFLDGCLHSLIYHNIIKRSQSPQATYSDDPETILPPPRWQKERGACLWNITPYLSENNYSKMKDF